LHPLSITGIGHIISAITTMCINSQTQHK
jgi:hypothetical protein